MNDTTGSEGAMRVDTGMVETLAKLLAENDLTEIEVEDGDRRISVKRKISAPAPAPVAMPQMGAPAPAAPVAAAAAPAAPTADNPASHPGVVASPMVGTAYLSAEPGSKPFAGVGERVEAGDTLLIIEAMKVMNQITAPKAGTVTRVLVQNAEPVEFGQPLIIVE